MLLFILYILLSSINITLASISLISFIFVSITDSFFASMFSDVIYGFIILSSPLFSIFSLLSSSLSLFQYTPKFLYIYICILRFLLMLYAHPLQSTRHQE